MAAAIPVILAVGGAGVNAYSSIKGGDISNKYYKDLANQNEIQSQDILDTASINQGYVYDNAVRDTSLIKNQLSQLLGNQKTALIGSGLSLSSKTAEDIARTSINQANEDEMAIRFNAENQAYQINREANLTSKKLIAEAKSYRKAGKNAKAMGYLGAFGSLLGGASKFIK